MTGFTWNDRPRSRGLNDRLPWNTHEALARLIHEIEALAPLIETAESQASPDARIRFRYDWLRQDLVHIRAGIQEHIDAPRTEPRTFPPLRGDYRL